MVIAREIFITCMLFKIASSDIVLWGGKRTKFCPSDRTDESVRPNGRTPKKIRTFGLYPIDWSNSFTSTNWVMSGGFDFSWCPSVRPNCSDCHFYLRHLTWCNRSQKRRDSFFLLFQNPESENEFQFTWVLNLSRVWTVWLTPISIVISISW